MFLFGALVISLYATTSITVWEIQKFPKQSIHDICQDKAGFIQLSTSRNLFKFDGLKFTKHSLPYNWEHTPKLKEFNKKGYVDRNGYHWKISPQGIIRVYAPSNTAIVQKKLKRENSDTVVIHHIFEDNHHFIWLASNIGLFRVHLEGTLPLSIPSSELVFTRFSTFSSKNDSLLHQTSQIDSIKQIVISSKRQFFEVEFSYPAFLSKRMPNYYYRLGDFNKKWIPLGNTNIITFHTMEYGKQQLWVKAVIPGYPKQEYIISKEIDNQYFSRKMPSVFLPIVLILFLILPFFLYQKKQYSKKKEKFRTRVSSDLHDEIGSTLTRISLGTDLLTAGILKPKEQEEMLEEVSDLSRNIMSIISDVIWLEYDENPNINSLIDRMKEEGGQLLSSANIKFSLNTHDLEDKLKFPPNYSKNIYLIFKEALNNVVKHSNATNVNVNLSKKNKKYLLKIDDNGTQSSNSIKQGQGLTNMSLRANKINGSIDIKKENGYTIRLEVPVS